MVKKMSKSQDAYNTVLRYISVFSLILSLLTFITMPANALPKIDNIASGSAKVSYPDSKTLKIDAADKTIINYKSFNIGENESVIFNLPNSTNEILNRVNSGEYSKLFGKLTSNGIVFLINSNGMLFGPKANVDVQGLIASTRDITNSDFLNSNYNFRKLSKNADDKLLVNEGNININKDGFAVFIAGAIENKGTIACPVSKVAMAAGDAVRIGFPSDGKISVIIDEKTANDVRDFKGKPVTDQIKNTGSINADGGMVLLKAESMPDILTRAINLEGFISAKQVNNKAGNVALVSNNNIKVNGKISATNIALDSGKEIKSTGSLEAQNNISLDAKGAVFSLGKLKAKTLNEKGASFLLEGDADIGSANIENDDNAITYGTGRYSGTYSDVQNIIINNNAVVTLRGNTVFRTDSDKNGSGSFVMNPGSSIVGGNYDLSLYASKPATLRTIKGVRNLNLNASRSGSNPSWNANNKITANGAVNINSSSLIMNSNDLKASKINGYIKGANYYVDSLKGNDSNAGTSVEIPWKSIKKVNSASFQPKDTVKFARGRNWRETLYLDSGAGSGYITYTAYGTGVAPRLLGSFNANKSSEWVKIGNNIWQNKNKAFSIDVGNIIFNGGASIGNKKWYASELKKQGDFWYDRNNKALRLYSTKNPGDYYVNVEAALRNNIIQMGGKHHVVVENLDLRYGGAHGIGGSSTSYITIQDNKLSYIGGGDQNNNGKDHIRFGNGVEFFDNSHDTSVRRNVFDNIYDAAMTTQGTSNGNKKYNQYFYNNIVKNCEYGFEYFNMTPNKNSNTHDIYVDNNTFINSGKGWGHNQRPVKLGASVMFGYDNGSLSKFYVRNNIVNGATDCLVYFNNKNTIPKISMNNNLYYTKTGNMALVLNYPRKTYSLGSWQKAFGKDKNSIYADPLLNSSYKPTSKSPAINRGATISYVNHDFTKKKRVSPYDIGAYEY